MSSTCGTRLNGNSFEVQLLGATKIKNSMQKLSTPMNWAYWSKKIVRLAAIGNRGQAEPWGLYYRDNRNVVKEAWG